jgi:hypothetical protein
MTLPLQPWRPLFTAGAIAVPQLLAGKPAAILLAGHLNISIIPILKGDNSC